RLQSDLNHMMDVAQVIKAKYWLASPDEYDNTLVFLKPLLAARSRELQTVLPVDFRSRGKQVVIYDLACVREPQAAACASAAPVLFPDRTPLGKAAEGVERLKSLASRTSPNETNRREAVSTKGND